MLRKCISADDVCDDRYCSVYADNLFCAMFSAQNRYVDNDDFTLHTGDF